MLMDGIQHGNTSDFTLEVTIAGRERGQATPLGRVP
jgi:hypothetical protein